MQVLVPSVRICGQYGQLLITAERVSCRSATKGDRPRAGSLPQRLERAARSSDEALWEAPRASVAGVSVTANLVSADLELLTREGKRYPLRGVLYRDALLIVELLGYVPSPDRAATGKLIVPTNYANGRFEVTEDVVRIEGRERWEVARAEVRGASVELGLLTAQLSIHLQDGRTFLADALPFNGALRAVELLGYLPNATTDVPAEAPAGALPPTFPSQQHSSVATSGTPTSAETAIPATPGETPTTAPSPVPSIPSVSVAPPAPAAAKPTLRPAPSVAAADVARSQKRAADARIRKDAPHSTPAKRTPAPRQ